jgi:ribonuclease D
VADDSVLVSLARIRPADAAHLSAFRGLNKGEIKRGSERLLGVIAAHARTALDGPGPGARPPTGPPPTQEEDQAVSLLRCFIGILADRRRIAARHIATADQLLPILRSRAKEARELSDRGLLSRGAADLAGKEILEFISGKHGLAIADGRIRVIEPSD